MAPDDSHHPIDLNTLTVQDVDRMLKDLETRRKQLLVARKHLVVIEQSKQALQGTMGGAVLQFPTPNGKKVDTAPVPWTPRSPGLPAPGSLDERIFEGVLELPLTAEKLAEKLDENVTSISKRLDQLEVEKMVGHFDIEHRKPTKHKGVSTPVIDRYYFWRPRSELSSDYRRKIITGLLMRKWWSNHDLIVAASAKTIDEKRDVDNMIRTLRRAENVWHKMGEEGKWIYWLREDRGEPPKELDGRDWGEKSIHARRKLKGAKERRSSSSED